MILLYAAAISGVAGADLSGQPGAEFIVCPGDARCPTPGGRPPGAYIICPGDRRCPPTLTPPMPMPEPVPGATPEPQYAMCPDGVRVPVEAPCPLVGWEGPLVIHFDADSVRLSAEAIAKLDEAVSLLVRAPSGRLTISGHTDQAGSAAYNLSLSRRLADAVRDHFIERGVPVSAISVEAFGETRPRFVTDGGASEPRNRRVEIVFDPTPGW